MKFFRAYAENDLRIRRGANANGTIRKDEEVWINIESGTVILKQQGRVCVATTSNMPGGGFFVYLMDEIEEMDLSEILGREKIRKKVVSDAKKAGRRPK